MPYANGGKGETLISISIFPENEFSSAQTRISWGIHGIPKVLLGPAMPYHYNLQVANP
jgi:hypothetical protein